MAGHKSVSANGKNQINFGIGFSIDQASYNQTLQSLKKLQNITQDDITGKAFGSKSMQNQMDRIKKSASEILKIWKQAFNSDLGTLNIQKFNSLLNSSGINLKKLGQDWKNAGEVGTSALRNLATSTLTANMNLKKTDSLINKMGTTFLNTIKWTFASSVINSFTGSIQQAFGYVKSLDSSLNDIRIVTGKSAELMNKFAVKANEAAKALGKQTTDYTNAALIYYQQGLGEEESNTLAETTLKVSNITGQNTKAVSEEITAVMNGYQLGANQVESAFDSLAAVAATTASDLEEISTGMSKVASTANMLGVPLDSLNAQLATIVSVTRQAPESVGTALKTIYARLNDLKLGQTDEDGIKLGDVSSSLEKMGIHILDLQKNLRNLGDVINEVAASWNNWSEAERIAMAESMAGKRQYNNLIALFDNWDMYTKALNTSLTAQGTIAKQNSIYLDSLAAHMNQFKAAQEGVMDSFIDSKSFKGLIDTGTKILGIVEKIIDALGGGGIILGNIATIAGRVFSNQIARLISNIVLNIQGYKYNLQQLQSTMLALKNTKTLNLGLNDDGMKIITDLKSLIMSFGNLVTPEEHNQANSIIQKIDALYQERDAWQLAYKAGEQAAAGMMEYVTILELANQSDQERVATLQKQSSELKIQQQQYNNSIKILQQLKQTKNQGEITVKQKDIEYLQESFEFLRKETNILTNDLGLSKDQIEAVAIAMKSLAKGELYAKGHMQAVEVALKAMNKAAEKTSAGLNSFNKATQNLGENFANRVKAAEAEWNQFINSLRVTHVVKQITQMVSSFGQLAMGLQTISNIGSIWSNDDINDGLKILQTITNIGFVLPQVISGFSGLQKAMAALGIIKIPSIELIGQLKQKLATQSREFTFANKWNQILEKEGVGENGSIVDNQTNAESYLKSYNLLNSAKLAGINVTKDMTLALFKLALQLKIAKGLIDEETAATLQNAQAKQKLGKSISIASMAVMAAVAVLNLFYQAAVKAKEALVLAAKKQLLASKEILDQRKELAKKTDELASSYKKLYEQYNKNTITQEEMRKSAYDLCKQYGDNNLMIQALSGSYKDLALSIREAQKEQNKQKIEAAQKVEENAESTLKKQAALLNTLHWIRNGKKGNGLSFNNMGADFYSNTFQSTMTEEDKVFANQLMELTGADFKTGTLDIEKNRNLIAKNYDKIQKLLADHASDSSSIFDNMHFIWQSFNDYFSETEDIWKELNSAKDDIKETSLNDIVLDKLDKDTIKNSDDKVEAYKETLKLMEDAAKEFFDTLAEAHDWALKQLADVEDIRKLHYINAINETAPHLTDDVQDYLNSLSELDLGLIISGDILFLGYEGVDALKKGLWALKQKLDPEDTSLAIQIRAKIAKGEDLKSEDIQSLSTQTGISSLSESLDSGSALDKLDRLKDATDALNLSTKEYLATTKEQALVELKSAQDNIKRLQDEADEIKKAGVNSQGEAEKLKKIEDEIAAYEKLASTLKEVGERSLAQVDDAVFQYIRNEIDSIITKAETLKSAAEMIGEGFKVAASDVQQFASLYPELLDQATYTAEGLMVLNQQVVQDFVNQKKELINANAEAKKSELNSLIAIYEARVKFDLAKIKALLDYLTTKKSESEILTELNQATGEFLQDVAEALGITQKELTDNAIKNINTEADAMYNFLDRVLLEYKQVNDYAQAALVGRAGGKPSLVAAAKSSLDGASFAASQNVEDIRTYRGADNFDKRVAQLKQEYLQRLADVDHLNELKAALSGVESSQRASIAALDRVAAGQAGKGSSKGGGSSKDPETKLHKDFSKDAIKDERDIYLEIDRIIQHTQKTLEKIQKTTLKLVGEDLEKALQEQQKLLAQQAANYEKKAEIAKEEQARLAEELSQKGFTFAENGELNNYNTAYTTNASRINALIQAIQDEVNAAIDAYNTLDAAGQLAQKDMLEELEKNAEARVLALKNEWSTITDGVSKYNEAINTAQEAETAAALAVEKQYLNMVSLFEKKIKITIDFNQAKREFIKFRKDIVNNFSKETARGLGVLREAALEELKTLLTNENSDVNTYTNELAKAQGALERMRESGSTYDDLTGFTQEKAFEIAKDAAKNLMSSMTDAKEAIDELFNAWFDGWDKIEEKFDNQVKKFDFMNDQLEHGKKLVTLLNGDKAYAQLDKYYDKQIENDQLKLDMLKRQKLFTLQEMLRQKLLMSKMTEGTRLYELAQKRYEALQNSWMDNVSELNSAIEQAIERLIEKYSNLWSKVISESKNSLTGGMDFDNAKEEWLLVKKNADLYLDDINKGFEILKLDLAFEKALENTKDNIQAQKALNDLREKELTKLKEKERITQYDVDRANALLTLEQKRIALEEAQNNKSRLKLRRDSQGNYSYQYTADEEDVGDKRTDYLNAMQNVYNMDRLAYRNNLDLMQAATEEYYSKMDDLREAYLRGDDTALEKMRILNEQYQNYITSIARLNTTIRTNLTESAGKSAKEVYDADTIYYGNMVDYELGRLNEDLVPGWKGAIQNISEQVNGDKGFIKTSQELTNQLITITDQYKIKLDETSLAAGRDFGVIDKGLEDIDEDTKKIIGDVKQWTIDNGDLIKSVQAELVELGKLVDLGNGYIDVLNRMVDPANTALTKWQGLEAQIEAATRAMQLAREEALKPIVSPTYNVGGVGGAGAATPNPNGGGDGSGSGSGGYGGGGNDTPSALTPHTPVVTISENGWDIGLFIDGVYQLTVGYLDYASQMKIHDSSPGAANSPLLRWKTPAKNQLLNELRNRYRGFGYDVQFDTGGYTGKWVNGDTNGRVALLHQKELVLNAEDTKNILSAVDIVRTMKDALNSITSNTSLPDFAKNFVSATNSSQLEQNVHITATFPNVTDRNEIRLALENITSKASQYINRR